MVEEQEIGAVAGETAEESEMAPEESEEMDVEAIDEILASKRSVPVSRHTGGLKLPDKVQEVL